MAAQATQAEKTKQQKPEISSQQPKIVFTFQSNFCAGLVAVPGYDQDANENEQRQCKMKTAPIYTLGALYSFNDVKLTILGIK